MDHHNNHPPRVSIGLPVYNAENYLAICLESLLAQTFDDLEIVVSDNGSTDRTEEICREFAARDPRVRYVRSPENRGASWNFGRVFELARGEYFKWAAHDDLCADDFVERCVALLDSRPDAVWCHARRVEIDDSGRILPPAPQTIEAADKALSDVCAAETPQQRFRSVLFAPGTSLDIYGVGRREALARTGLHRSYYGADKVFLAEMALLGPWLEVPERLFQLRRHSSQSIWIATQREQEQWIAGEQASRLRTPRQLRCTAGYLGLALRAPVNFGQRIRCLATVAGFAANPGKWRRLCIDALRSVGVRIHVPEDALRPPQAPPSGNGPHRRCVSTSR